MPRGQYDREAARARREMTTDVSRETIEAPTTRADEVRQERRRRPGQTGLAGIKLSTDESKLDRSTYHYRFARASGGRLQQLHGEDYDVAPEGAKPDGNSLGTVNSVHGGVDDAGKPYDLVLMRKRKDWFETDRKEKQKPLDEMDEAIRRNNVNHKANTLMGPGVYSPGVNSMDKV